MANGHREGMTNGFTVRSWSDLTSLILILSFLISGLVWGMKLESRYDSLNSSIIRIQSDIASIQTSISSGILPMAQERIDVLTRKVKRLEDEIRDHEKEQRSSK